MKFQVTAVLAATALAFAFHSPARGDSTKSVSVDCGGGDTIAKALTKGNEDKPLVVTITGTCNENVLIDRNDVTLQGMPGATISGPDPALDVVRVTASRTTIQALTVTGGRNGVHGEGASGLTVRGVTAQNTGRTGIVYNLGASGIIDGATVQNNPRDGIAIESAATTVLNSSVNQNGRHGIGVFDAGAARIGVDNSNNAGGNVITANTVNGVHIVFGSSAFVGMNQIIGNGNPTGNGINLSNASADILGGNTISGNNGTGINLRMSSAVIGDANFGLTTVNTITGNGNPTSQGGISGFLGSSLAIRDAVISNNVGFGLIGTTRTSIQIQSSTIQNNVAFAPGTGDGIRLVFGSALFASAPVGSVTGNAGFGLLCTDGESSVINTALLGVGANALGGVSAACTGF